MMGYVSNKFCDSLNNEYVWLRCKGHGRVDIEYFLDAFNKALAKILEVDYEILEDEALRYNPEDISIYFDKFALCILAHLDTLEKSRFDIFDYVEREDFVITSDPVMVNYGYFEKVKM